MSPAGRQASALEARLAYRFQDPALLAQALRPASTGLSNDNQRLEFLGDAVLHLTTSALLCREHPDWPEGALSKLRGMLVCADALHAWAEDLGVQLETGPRSPRRPSEAQTRNALADAMEALLAAIFLDAGASGEDGLAAAQRVVEARFLGPVRAAYPGVWEARDPKTTLQERGAALGLAAPVYELIDRSGPDHAPRFRVRVAVGAHAAEAEAGSLKRAQAAAAAELLGRLPGNTP